MSDKEKAIQANGGKICSENFKTPKRSAGAFVDDFNKAKTIRPHGRVAPEIRPCKN